MNTQQQVEKAIALMQEKGIRDEMWWGWVRRAAAAFDVHLRPLVFYPLALNLLFCFLMFASVFAVLMTLFGRVVNPESLLMGAAVYCLLREVMSEGRKRKHLPSWDSLSR